MLHDKNVDDHVYTWYAENILHETEDPFQVGMTQHLPGLRCVDVALFKYSKEELKRANDFAQHYDAKFVSTGKRLNIQQTMSARASQAFAEVAIGPTIFFFTHPEHDGANMDPDTTWGGFEFPALTRNPNIEKIIQVDASFTLRDENGEVNPKVHKVIWQRSDGPSAQEPRGELFAYGVRRAPGQLHYGKCEELEQMFVEKKKNPKKSILWGPFRLWPLPEEEGDS